jgi:hypothetical protein
MTVIIKIELKNSAVLETPESIKRMAEGKIRQFILDDPVLLVCVQGYTVEVV